MKTPSRKVFVALFLFVTTYSSLLYDFNLNLTDATLIPDWLVVKRISEVSIPREDWTLDMEEWPRIARERVNKFVQGIRWYPTRGRMSTSYEREVFEEFAGHGLLRLAAAEKPKIFGWLIEQEADLFQWRFENVKNIQEQLEVANYLFGKENILEPRTLWTKFDINNHYFNQFRLRKKREKTIGIHFSCVPKMVGIRSVLIRLGWAIGLIEDFSGGLKVAFERLLKQRITESGERMDRTARTAVSEIQEELSKVIHSMARASGEIDLEDYRLFHRQDIFPQCMLDLYNELMNKGHVGHNERFQLGLFLKKLGMTAEEQQRFWYTNAIDNVGLTFEQFSSGQAGYIIRHMYGLEGGETDYRAPKCSTIQDSYYCTFLHQSIATIDENLRKEFKNPSQHKEGLIRELERKAVEKKPSEACAVMFSLRYNRGCKSVRHPLGYTTYAAKVKGIIEDPSKGGKEGEGAKDRLSTKE